MSVYLSQDSLRQWTDRTTVERAQALYENGCVSGLQLGDDMCRATITTGGSPVRTRFRILSDGLVETMCPCRFTQENGLVCIHVTAAGFLVAKLTEDPSRERKRRVRLRQRVAAQTGDAVAGILARKRGDQESLPASLRLRLESDWGAQWDENAIGVTVFAEYREARRRLEKVPADLALGFDASDFDLLFVLEDISRGSGSPSQLWLTRNEFLEVLGMLAPGRLHISGTDAAISVESTARVGALTAALDEKTGTIQIVHRIGEPVDRYLIGKRHGWVYVDQTLAPLEAVLPELFHGAYGPEGMHLSRDHVPGFIERDLATLEDAFIVEHDIADDQISVVDGTPEAELEIAGTPESLDVRVWAVYGESRGRAARVSPGESECYPAPGSPLTYLRRNLEAETGLLDALEVEGFFQRSGQGFRRVEGPSDVIRTLTEIVPELQRRGWKVGLGGVIEGLASGSNWIRPVVRIRAAEPGWFESHIAFVAPDGTEVEEDAIDAAISAGSAGVDVGGHQVLVNGNLIQMLRTTQAECALGSGAHDDQFRDIYAGYFGNVLRSHDEVEVHGDAIWERQVKRHADKISIEEVELNPTLTKTLRPYQHEGVNWLRFLETGGYCGILADEMGLGKTVQALAWIELERLDEAARGRPALILCPTSLVENWARETARFTPKLSCLMMHGASRHKHWDTIMDYDLIVTSYALLRRDIEFYTEHKFAVAVLDEAQHIKNRSTQNARAAKQIRAVHRLVLTGTPMENSVNDLWSIMDFLMPNYLGGARAFSERFERPVSLGGLASGDALRKLRYKMQPFMLRRLKTAVAEDLPEKVTRVATCTMEGKQLARYRALAREYQENLSALVRAKGFDSARFAVLSTLTRLRQLCCHPALLKESGVGPEAKSAKMDLFFELLNEAIDGGHRVLVFSQFVEMLKILRTQLEERGISYAYLDGATRERQREIDRFNGNDDVPVFLVSLKAGGTGLNLTGANVVIHYDPWWNPAVEDQATDRAHRIGQTRSVYSIKLITQGTIEERVLALQEQKRGLIDATVGDENAPLKKLTWDDVQELLAI